MELNFKDFKKNIKMIVVILFFLVILIFIKQLLPGEGGIKLDEKDLPKEGSETYGKLVINEIMASNKGAFSSEEGVVSDWIELYNGNDHEINLKNYGLSDTETKIKWVFPDVTIKPKSYLIVYLAGLNRDGLYTNFKLRSSGSEK